MTEKENRLKMALRTDEDLIRLKQNLKAASQEYYQRRFDRRAQIPQHEAWIIRALAVVRRIRDAITRRRAFIYTLKWDRSKGRLSKPKKVKMIEAQIEAREGAVRRKLYRMISLEAVEAARKAWAEDDKNYESNY